MTVSVSLIARIERILMELSMTISERANLERKALNTSQLRFGVYWVNASTIDLAVTIVLLRQNFCTSILLLVLVVFLLFIYLFIYCFCFIKSRPPY